MNIEWTEDLAGGTADRPTWTVRARAGDVVVELRHGVRLSGTPRHLQNMRIAALDSIRAGLGLPQDAIQEDDSKGVAEAMGALRRMIEETGR